MKLIKFILYLLTLLGFLLIGCNKDSPVEKAYYITGGFVQTDGFILPEINFTACDEPVPGPHIHEFANLNGRHPANQTDYVYDMFYDMDFYCEDSHQDEMIIFEGSAFGSKKMAMQVLFDEVGNYYLLSMLRDEDIEELTYELIVDQIWANGSLPHLSSITLGMLHMGMGDFKGNSPMLEGVVPNWGADEITLSGRDTLYYFREGLLDNRMVISDWHIELEAR